MFVVEPGAALDRARPSARGKDLPDRCLEPRPTGGWWEDGCRSRSTLALDAIREAGHGGHFFGTAHTLANYTTAFYEPLVSDWSNFETWSENGGLTAFERANRIYRERLAQYQPPDMDASVRQSLEHYVGERRRELELAK